MTRNATSHLTHCHVVALNACFAGRNLVDTTRLTSSPAQIWRDIAATNAAELVPAIDTLVEALVALRRDLGEGDQIDELFTDAARWREILVKGSPR